MDVEIEPSGVNYFGSMNISVCTGTNTSQCRTNIIFEQQKLKKPTCSGRRKRRSASETTSNTTDEIIAIIQELIDAGASSADIEEFLEQVKASEVGKQPVFICL